MTRNGKTARLSRTLRGKPSRQLRDGVPGAGHVRWSNSLLLSRDVFARDFAGRPLTQLVRAKLPSGIPRSIPVHTGAYRCIPVCSPPRSHDILVDG